MVSARSHPNTLGKAYKRLIFLKIWKRDDSAPSAPKPDTLPIPETRNMILHHGCDGARVGQYLTNANPDFDTRTYGKKKLGELVTEPEILETRKRAGNQLMIRCLDWLAPEPRTR